MVYYVLRSYLRAMLCFIDLAGWDMHKEIYFCMVQIILVIHLDFFSSAKLHALVLLTKCSDIILFLVLTLGMIRTINYQVKYFSWVNNTQATTFNGCFGNIIPLLPTAIPWIKIGTNTLQKIVSILFQDGHTFRDLRWLEICRHHVSWQEQKK